MDFEVFAIDAVVTDLGWRRTEHVARSPMFLYAVLANLLLLLRWRRKAGRHSGKLGE